MIDTILSAINGKNGQDTGEYSQPSCQEFFTINNTLFCKCYEKIPQIKYGLIIQYH